MMVSEVIFETSRSETERNNHLNKVQKFTCSWLIVTSRWRVHESIPEKVLSLKYTEKCDSAE